MPGVYWAGSFMPMLMDPFTANPFQVLESHRSSAQKRGFSSCPVVELFTHKTTRAQLWSALWIISCGIKLWNKTNNDLINDNKYCPSGSYVNP